MESHPPLDWSRLAHELRSVAQWIETVVVPHETHSVPPLVLAVHQNQTLTHAHLRNLVWVSHVLPRLSVLAQPLDAHWQSMLHTWWERLHTDHAKGQPCYVLPLVHADAILTMGSCCSAPSHPTVAAPPPEAGPPVVAWTSTLPHPAFALHCEIRPPQGPVPVEPLPTVHESWPCDSHSDTCHSLGVDDSLKARLRAWKTRLHTPLVKKPPSAIKKWLRWRMLMDKKL